MTDNEAVIAYQNGDQEGFDFLFNKYKNALLGYCWKIVNNEQDAEDISQEVWMYLFSYLSEFKRDCSFVTMMYLAARDRALNFIRDNENPEIAVDIGTLYDTPVSATSSPDSDLMINDLLSPLDTEEKVLMIAKIEGYSDEELADKYDKPVNTVKSDIFRVREKLREVRTQ